MDVRPIVQRQVVVRQYVQLVIQIIAIIEQQLFPVAQVMQVVHILAIVLLR